LAPAPEPRPIDQYFQELCTAKREQRRHDAALAFEEKVEIVLELQEASRLIRAGAGAAPARGTRDRTR